MFRLGRNAQTQQARFEVTRLVMSRVVDAASGVASDEPRLSHAAVRSTASVERAVWMHIAGTYEPKTGALAIYFNGVRENAFVASPPGVLVAKRGAPLMIGRSSTLDERKSFIG